MLAILPRSESSPPLHYVAAWGWGNVFGLSEAGVRSLSVLAGVATVPVAYLAGRELAGLRAGLIAAALVAVSPFLVFYSLEARAYSLLTLLGALSFWLFARALRRPEARPLALWAVVSALALATHYFAGFLVVVEAAWLLVATGRSRPAVAAVGGVLLAAVALLPLALDQADGRTGWIGQTGLATRARQTATQFVVGEIDPVSNLVLVLVLATAAIALALVLRGHGGEAVRAARVPLGVAAAAVAVPLVLDLLGAHYLIARNAIAVVPVLAVGLGALLAAAPPRPAAAFAVAACALGLAISMASWFDPALQRPDTRAAAESLDRSPSPVVVAPYLSSAQLALYAPRYAQAGPELRTDRIDVIEPVRRRGSPGPSRPPTPSPPPGFAFLDREDRGGYARIAYHAPKPRPLVCRDFERLSPPQPPWDPIVLIRR
jgi:mannosyltransferase